MGEMASTKGSPRVQESIFPSEILLPKNITQLEEFWAKHPTYDGRNMTIAILDTGVDPALPGLQTTTTGERKMIDCVDCSGAGDVDTSVVKQATDGVIIGLSGRKLKIPTDWVNPSGKYHLGIKPIYELYPKTLRKVIREERKKNIWDPSHQIASADVLRQLTKHEEALGGSSEKVADKLDREDLASQVDFLKFMEKEVDKGPVADVLVWNDGKEWQACLDTSFRGRLNLCTPMTSFRKSGQFGKLTERDEITYSYRIDPKGNFVEIVVPIGSHGSHVANIAAAHFPDDSKRNGTAPGAKIVSFTIGDNRIDSMETGTALTRAFNMCVDYGVNVVNMSFGEGTHICNKGRVIEEIKHLVDKHNVMVIISAGNNGPALSTVGAPGGTSDRVLGIGAFITPEMADPLYGVHEKIAGNLYHWSSRGPAMDGSLGVSLCAPGAALTGVPKYCRVSGSMMNGTSMSSPNAAGVIASLLSALKAENIPWTYYQVRLALENTALDMQNIDKFSQGQGMIQISNAYQFLKEHNSFLPANLNDIEVNVSQGITTGRGVYLREVPDMNFSQEYVVSVNPKFQEFGTLAEPIEFEKLLILKCNAPWVKHPKNFVLIGESRSFVIEVDPSSLESGDYFTEVLAYDPSAIDLGPIFRVPITVLKPDEASVLSYAFDAHSAVPVRKFVNVPAGAKVMEIKVTSLSQYPKDRFLLHTVYRKAGRAYRNAENAKMLGPDLTEWTNYLPVEENKNLEVCITRPWTRGVEKPSKIRMDISFHGVERPSLISLTHGLGSKLVHGVSGSFRDVEIKPTVSFKTLTSAFKQEGTPKIEPMGPTDVFRDGIQIHRLLLTYKLTTTKPCEIRLELPGLSEYLYENPLDCLLFQIFSATKEFLSGASTYPDRYTHKLNKGEFIIQAQVRHPSVSVLEKIKDVPLLVHMKLPAPIDMDVYSAPEQPITGNGDSAWKKKALKPGQEFEMYFGGVNDEKLAKLPVAIKSGSLLSGHLHLLADASMKTVDKSDVDYHFLEYSSPSSSALSMITLKEKEVKKEPKDEMTEAVRDLQISWLEKLTTDAEVNALFAELVAKYPNHLPLLLQRIKKNLSKKVQTAQDLEESKELIQRVLDITKPLEVLQYLGCKQDYNEEQVHLKKSMEERKNAIIDVLIASATMAVDSHLQISTLTIPAVFKKELKGVLELPKATPEEKLEEMMDEVEVVKNDAPVAEVEKISRKEVDDAYSEVVKWIAADDNKTLLLSAKHAIAHGHYGRALKYLNKTIEEGRGTDKNTLIADLAVSQICNIVGWIHIANLKKNDVLVRHSAKYRPFQAI